MCLGTFGIFLILSDKAWNTYWCFCSTFLNEYMYFVFISNVLLKKYMCKCFTHAFLRLCSFAMIVYDTHSNFLLLLFSMVDNVSVQI